jgi:hypothetical protein
MNVKILVRGAQYSSNPASEPEFIRVEFTSDNDYFWLYIHEMEIDEFASFRKA